MSDRTREKKAKRKGWKHTRENERNVQTNKKRKNDSIIDGTKLKKDTKNNKSI